MAPESAIAEPTIVGVWPVFVVDTLSKLHAAVTVVAVLRSVGLIVSATAKTRKTSAIVSRETSGLDAILGTG